MSTGAPDLTRFHCRRCGACCRIPGGLVRLRESESASLAAALGMDERTFLDRHTLLAPDRRSLVFRDCASDHAREGHALKSRALETIVERCVFDDGDDGRSSYLLDCPNGGLVRVARCRFVQSPVAPNGTMVSVGEEGHLHPGSALDLQAGLNEFENRRASGTEVRSLVPARKTSQPFHP